MPPQSFKNQPLAGVAVRTMSSSGAPPLGGNHLLQVEGQLIPAGSLTTVPEPVRFTVSGTAFQKLTSKEVVPPSPKPAL